MQEPQSKATLQRFYLQKQKMIRENDPLLNELGQWFSNVLAPGPTFKNDIETDLGLGVFKSLVI